MEYLERNWESTDWITAVLLGILVLLALARYFFPKRFEEFILLPVTNKYFLLQGKDNQIRHPFNIMVFVIQLAGVSLFLYIIVKHFYPEQQLGGILLYIQICLFYLVFVALKYCVEKIIGITFAIEDQIDQYLYQKLTYRSIMTLLILAFCLVFIYIIPPSSQVLTAFVAILLVLNCIALFSSYKNNRKLILGHFFYFILYLCALEISPYIILYKAVV